jgi:dTDP-4-amino-4,6-dideoxygalactose transaminase
MSERISFLALEREYREVEGDVERRFRRVLDTQSFVLGEQSVELERSMRELTGARHAVACSSGSDALYLALRALDIRRGSAVLVPAYTFIATAEAIVNAGAVPVFTDVDPATLVVGKREIESAVNTQLVARDGAWIHAHSGARLAAAVVVHLFGRAAAMGAIDEAATDFGFRVIEDAAQAIGAAGDAGMVGRWGAAACFSFYPTKNLGGAGDGGIVTTHDADVAARVARLRVHGAGSGPLHEELGINARMGELQAAYLNAKWPRWRAWTAVRERLASAYDRRLAGLTESGRVGLLARGSAPAHVHHQYAVRIPHGRRDRVRAALAARGIDSRVFYPVPLHRQPCFAGYGCAQRSFPAAEAAAEEILCLPVHPFLDDSDVDFVCATLAAALAS